MTLARKRAEEGLLGDQGHLLPIACSASQSEVFPALQRQSPAEITSPQGKRRGSYRGTTITSTAQQVDRCMGSG